MINALGIICIILAVGLIAAIVNNYNQPDVDDLEDQIANLQNQVASLTDKVSDYETQISDLTDENNEYTSIINLENSAVLIDEESYTQEADDKTVLFDDELHYAGYIEIQVESTSDTTYIQVTYTYDGVEFDQTITVGNSGTAYFPVLPDTIKIVLGNTDTGSETIDTTVTLTYIY